VYGPVPGGVESVRNERLILANANTIELQVGHDSLNLRFVNVRVNVLLTTEQVQDETMVNALLAFRRAANTLAQEEDRIIFDGYLRGGNDQPQFVANNQPRPQRGLADPLERMRFPLIPGSVVPDPADPLRRTVAGNNVVPQVVQAITRLENNSNPSPFACILGSTLYEVVHTPNRANLVLPADRIIPIVKGPLLRCGQMNPFAGIVVSLAAGAVDIVVGTPPTVQFLQRDQQGRFFFRVYERFVLRLRDNVGPPVEGFTIPHVPSAGQALGGAGVQGADALARAANAAVTTGDAIVYVVNNAFPPP
jgi:uncharacterized linocin/CFP29 family protein